jgi:hypothetical protein
MLVNLIVNARDALSHGGRITVETANVQIDQGYCRDHVDAKPGDYVVLTVADDGSGMDDDTLAHIFEPFFSTKETGKGTGLGLATVYGVIKQNDGFVSVTSSVGRGSTFKLFIPRFEGQLLEPSAPISIPAARGRGTILLVEDDDMVRDLTRSMREALGYTVVSADSARAALSLCADMSGYAPSLVIGPGAAGQPVRFIQKPFTMAELARSVQSALQPGVAVGD